MRVVFMGSPQFAVPSLEILADAYPIVGVVTQPDRKAGRGRKIRQSAVKVWSLEHGLPIMQPRRLKDPEAIEKLKNWTPDLIVVAAFGQILPEEVLELPEWGCLNVHASLLPRWRGAAPVHASILHGDTETGITIMKMDVGLDTGPILSQTSTPIDPQETGGQLSDRLSQIGAVLLLETIPSYLEGNIKPIEQNHEQATYAPMLKKSDGALDFNLTAEELARQVRAFEPWPGSFFTWKGKRIVVRKAHVVSDTKGTRGAVNAVGELPAVSTSQGSLVLEILQPAGGKSMPGDAFMRGARGFLGTELTSPSNV
ncbi:MAG: methionyl-tRNA formyltransferase [Anaerolineaceae bacterium]|nr:MAG: methionyl-tRNA formyltransferase [Anaerolineaceae bacterium]